MENKYTDKHAVRIVREEDKQDLIAFFEAIKSDCNEKFRWQKSKVLPIGMIIYIDEYGHLDGWDLENFKEKYSDYTILEGIPQDWREGMSTEERMADKMLDMARTEISLETQVKELKHENRRLRISSEILIKGLEHIGKWGDEEESKWDDPGSCALDTLTQYRYSLEKVDNHKTSNNLELYKQITFNQFIKHGINHAVTIVNEMPLSWQINGKNILRESDDIYIVETIDGEKKFHKGEFLIAYEDGLWILKNSDTHSPGSCPI